MTIRQLRVHYRCMYCQYPNTTQHVLRLSEEIASLNDRPLMATFAS